MSVRFKSSETVICRSEQHQLDDGTLVSSSAARISIETESGLASKEEDDKSISEESSSEESDDDDYENDQENEKGGDETCSAVTKPLTALCRLSSSPSARSIIEWDDNGQDVGCSQDPRSFLSRMFWNETDVRFYNDTAREVMFVIADEEFTLKRTSKANIGASVNDDDDDDNEDPFQLPDSLFGFIPVSVNAKVGHSRTQTQTALKTRCMPLAPRSNSSQHFQEERLTYVTALTKDVDGEDTPWTRVHYENKVINCKRTKSLKFLNKHLIVTAYRIAQPNPNPASQQSPTRMPSPKLLTATDGKRMITRGQSRKRLLEKHESKRRIKDG